MSATAPAPAGTDHAGADAGAVPAAPRQPWLHDLVALLRAPTQVWSPPSGQITGEGVSGAVHADTRVLSRCVLRVAGVEPVPVGHDVVAVDEGVFTSLTRDVSRYGSDPVVRLERRRHVAAGRVSEDVEVRSWREDGLQVDVTVELACDFAPVHLIKAGRTAWPATPVATAAGARWSEGDVAVTVDAPGADVEVHAAGLTLRWPVDVPMGGERRVSWSVQVDTTGPVTTGTEQAEHPQHAIHPDHPRLAVHGDDPRWGPVLHGALSDLGGLRMPLAGVAGASFLAAGAPWFLTMFGRDSLWAARMLLPVSTSIAADTLRALAHFQGRGHDPATEEAPGKILHELRAMPFPISGGPDDPVERVLPPVYYGAIDSTPLWILTLHDAWRWGMPAGEVAALVPNLRRALEWLVTDGDVDGDGFLEYQDSTGTGLANQGWKDSGDGIRDADGLVPPTPLALCEVQGYAYAAAVAGARLLREHGEDGADELTRWAGHLRARFRESFWVRDAVGPFPAVALDGDKRPVASLTSNIGHLLGTGILDDHECAVVVRRLLAADMFSGFGLRTLSASAPGFTPVGYHVGAVWPHDTAITIAGMAAEGAAESVPLAVGLLDAFSAFGNRPPELFCGDSRESHPRPLPYPAACRPQAWSSAAAVSLLASMLGLRPDHDRLVAAPVNPWPFGALSVRGLAVGGRRFGVDVDSGGRCTVTEL